MSASLQFFPLLPQAFYALLAAGALLLFLIAWRKRLPDLVWRGAFFLFFALLLAGPALLKEVRRGLPDKLLIVVDDSASQKVGGRDKTAEEALKHIEAALEKIPGVDPVVIRAANASGKEEGTLLFAALRDQMAHVPLSQVAGTVLITDGQAHDAPQALGALERLGPFHAVLTGDRDEFDRQVSVVAAPKYGVTGEEVKIAVKVENFGRRSAAPVSLSIAQDGEVSQAVEVASGEVRELSFTLKRQGQNVFEFSVPAMAGELTEANNAAPVIINGIRDRLRVLLVSATPHMGERAWRNLLKSDPSVDLVHFTILRPPTAMDPTPPRDMALIAFPVEELFQRRLRDFDLIIFDRNLDNRILQPRYFSNIAAFVRAGGAFLMTLGEGQDEKTEMNADLRGLLPVTLRPDTLKETYVPQTTEKGRAHPVTADLDRGGKAAWGPWRTQAAVTQTRGDLVMTGANGLPLLVLDKVEQGRVAVLASDNVWLWSKGGVQAGPYTSLLRNVAHWLMKKPELEDDYIQAKAGNGKIVVEQRNPGGGARSINMTDPSGASETVELADRGDGWAAAEIEAVRNGIFSFSGGKGKAFAAVGAARNLEFADVHATEERLKPVVDETGGGIVWFREHPDFSLRRVSSSAGSKGGGDWIGLKKNEAYAVSHVEGSPVLPDWLTLALLLAGMVVFWRREST